ncbi:UDP-3-O-(3-hydroxymyristoyl) glucosamine N-acyltransferase [Nitrincola sp. A-D6]|uniref:UDP-3-O-(3-hydroxymyristoyl)glucosamine N-acyltransferase n=1 Tax=Nitrincola sp. A-D6 TaxID=1545442 RepID=UPI00051FE733|nr:UDP-3-O-(3-hydroxymyristoyl)glucosamine N-acyltransferase [Nitrincola sp. A-D6]KGK43299.1 UDP-3-O-(3-hydroxymyristoyl) glucosamine N-acyltransferase [Nitrincola sp. A-D6]
MGYELNKSIRISELAEHLSFEWQGADILIKGVSSSENAKDSDVIFSKSIPENIGNIAIVISPFADIKANSTNGLIIAKNPRLEFINVLRYLEKVIGFSTWNFPSIIHPTVKLGKNVVVESGCVIDEYTVIEPNVVLHSGTRIGKNSRIRSCSSIGGDGFGFERMSDGVPLRFPHLGGVVIGDNVEIGALNSIARGTLSDTVISNNVKTDNLVHIAHNCFVQESVLITACAELSGGVTLGKRAWIGPNVSIMQKIFVGDDALVGLGAVVTKNIPSNTVFAGNPAKKIRDI